MRQALCIATVGLAVVVAGCGSDRREDRAAVEIRGTDPATGASAPAATAPGVPAVTAAPSPALAAPGAGGVVDYGTYQSVVARQGDTVADLAGRVGLSASELAAYNGLTPSHQLRAGDELVLPSRPGGYDAGATAVAAVDASTSAVPPVTASPAPVVSAIETAPLPGTGAAEPAGTSDGWSPDIAAAAIERSSGIKADGTLGAPPSSSDPVPPEPEPRRELASPGLGQYQTGQSGSATPPPAPEIEVAAAPAQSVPGVRLLRPVEGPVAVGFNKGAGPARNDGVDFAAAAGSRVVAAADGEVALVSQSLGGLGTIVLVRHPNELLTVYGRIDNVTVSKGDIVQAGQAIGVVSNATAPAEPRMHFEVRRGAESLDPMLFL